MYLHTRLQFHKIERRPTQSGCDYASRFISSFSGTSVSLLLSPLRMSGLRTCLQHANVTYTPRVYVCACVAFIFFCTRIPHAFLYLSPAAPLASRFIRTHVCAHVHRHTECSPNGLSITLSRQLHVYGARSRFGRFRVPCRSHLIPRSKSREISRCVHEIKNRKRRKYSSKRSNKKVVLRTRVLLQLYSGMF